MISDLSRSGEMSMIQPTVDIAHTQSQHRNMLDVADSQHTIDLYFSTSFGSQDLDGENLQLATLRC